jgi:hypothetical protein
VTSFSIVLFGVVSLMGENEDEDVVNEDDVN